MSHVSDCIRPPAPLHQGPGTAGAKTFKFTDDSVTIYPRLPNGQSCRVVIIRRTVTCSHGSIFKVVHNAGKWSYKITYAYAGKPTSLTKEKFVKEVTRIGGSQALHLLLAAV